MKSKVVAVDTETTGLNPWRPRSRWGVEPDRPFAVSFCDSDGNTAYVRWEVDPRDRRIIHDKKSLAQVRAILSDPRITKVFHNVSFDHRMLEASGIKVEGEFHDTIFLMHVMTGGAERKYGLKELSEKYLGIEQEDQKELIKSVHSARRLAKKNGMAIAQKETHGSEPVYADFWLGEPNLCEKYAVMDAIRTMLLFQRSYAEVLNDADMMKVYQRELNLFWAVRSMEDTGCRVHPADIVRLKKFYRDYMAEQMKLVEKLGGKGLNFNSPKQMQKKFYDERGHEAKFNDNGGRSLDSKQLSKLGKTDKLAKAILEWKAGDHMLSAFLHPYERFMVQEGKDLWVLHARYKQCGPITGRFSCSDPNLMNVASESTGDRKADIALKPRECLGPRDGFVWYMPDWSQIEVWIFAFLAKDPTMMDALLSGKDFHATNALKAWGNKPDYKEREKIYRKRAKALFFGRLFGGGRRTVSETLECSLDDAAEYIGEFESELPGVARFIEETSQKVEEQGFIKNVFGRKYGIEPDFSYRGVNYIVQGTAADVAKRSMIRIHNFLEKECKEAKLILMLHDEFAIEVPKKRHSKELMRAIIREMQRDSAKLGIKVPVPVDMDIVESRWSYAVELCRKHLESNCCDKVEGIKKPKYEKHDHGSRAPHGL